MTTQPLPNIRAHASTFIACALITSACATTPHYSEPQLPVGEAAKITLDTRAKVLTIEDLPLADGDGGGLLVEPGCRTLTAKYEEAFDVSGAKQARRKGVSNSPSAIGNLAAEIANSEHHDYETTKPIRFNFDAKAGHQYWVTASFTGDQFIPRLVELDASGEASATYLPDVPCGRN
jgi:hypothetical protein